MTTPQEMVERAIALSRSDGCIVIADESSSANLRWANNTLTTNGVTRGRTLTVIATAARPFGGETTVIALDAVRASTGQPTALDLVGSGTLRPELLVGEDGAEAITHARATAAEG